MKVPNSLLASLPAYNKALISFIRSFHLISAKEISAEDITDAPRVLLRFGSASDIVIHFLFSPDCISCSCVPCSCLSLVVAAIRPTRSHGCATVSIADIYHSVEPVQVLRTSLQVWTPVQGKNSQLITQSPSIRLNVDYFPVLVGWLVVLRVAGLSCTCRLKSKSLVIRQRVKGISNVLLSVSHPALDIYSF